MKREAIDLHEVRAAHLSINERLINWARWCNGGRRGSATHPMFQQYRHGYEEPSAGSTVDSLDGHRIEKVVVSLPERYRLVLQWAYVRPFIPVMKVRRALGLTHSDLCAMMHDARAMVCNRAV